MMKNFEIISLPKIEDPRGNLSFIEHSAKGMCPFPIGEVSWIYDVPSGAVRSRGSSLDRREMIVAMSGSFDVVIEVDGSDFERVHLNRSDIGVVVAENVDTRLDNFSTNSVAMILSSTR